MALGSTSTSKPASTAAGSDNYLIGAEYGGFGVSGYNNQICNIEKYTGDALEPDCEWPQLIVNA